MIKIRYDSTPCQVPMKQQEAINKMLPFCLHPVLSFLFPWPENPVGLAPDAVAACRCGRDGHWTQAAREAWTAWASTCRATPFSTHQMENELFGKSGRIPPARSKASHEFCFSPRVMGIIRWRCPRLSQLSGKRRAPSSQAHSTAESWVQLNYGLWIPQNLWKHQTCPWLQTCPPALGPDGHYFPLMVVSMSGSWQDKTGCFGLFMLWFPQLWQLIFTGPFLKPSWESTQWPRWRGLQRWMGSLSGHAIVWELVSVDWSHTSA